MGTSRNELSRMTFPPGTAYPVLAHRPCCRNAWVGQMPMSYQDFEHQSGNGRRQAGDYGSAALEMPYVTTTNGEAKLMDESPRKYCRGVSPLQRGAGLNSGEPCQCGFATTLVEAP